MAMELQSCFRPVEKPGEAGRRIMHAHLGLFGDLVCWNCYANIVVPPGFIAREGFGRCPICRARFRVAADVAERVNAALGPTPDF